MTSFVLAELARTDSHRFRTLSSDSDCTKALRALTRAWEDLVRRRVGLADQLRDQLAAFWPGAGKVFCAVDSPIALAFLRRYPGLLDAGGLGEQRMAAFLQRHSYNGRKPARELLSRLRDAAEGRAGELEIQARRQIVLALVTALEPIVEKIAQLTAEIRHALDEHPDGPTFRSLFIAPDSWLCAASVVSEIGDCRERYPSSHAGRRRRPSPRRRRIRQFQTRPIPMGLRPPTTRSLLHPRRLKPPPQPMGSQHLRPRPRQRRQPPTRRPHPRSRLEPNHLAALARPRHLRPPPPHRPTTAHRSRRLTQGV